MSLDDVPTTRVRLDVWLDVACLFRTRSEAQRACKGGKVDVNGQASKPHREIRPGDVIEITRPLGRRQQVIVRAVADRHVPKSKARELYDDRTPPPSREEVEMRRLARLMRAFGQSTSIPRAPNKRDRRLLRQMRGKG